MKLMKIIMAIMVIMLLSTPVSALAGWLYTHQTTLNTSTIPAGLTNFSVMVQKTYTGLNANATDLRIYGSDNSTQWPREIESYNVTTGLLTYWTKIPNTTADTYWIEFGGNATATEPAKDSTYGAENVWDANYLAVWHMNQDPTGGTGAVKDSTSNENNMTNTLAAFGGSAMIDANYGKGIDFTGTEGLASVSNIAITGSSVRTEEIYMDNFDTASSPFIFSSGSDGSDLRFGFYGGGSGTLNFFGHGGSDYDTGSYLGGTYNSVTGKFGGDGKVYSFVNGSDTVTTAQTKALNTGTGKFTIGYRDGYAATGFNALVTEVRISNLNRSVSWVRTSNNNSFNPTATGAYASYSSFENISTTADFISSTSPTTVDAVAGQTVNFWAIASATVTTWDWTGVDTATGNSTTSSNASKVFATSGKYTVTVACTTANGTCAGSSTFTIHVLPSGNQYPFRGNLSYSASILNGAWANFTHAFNLTDLYTYFAFNYSDYELSASFLEFSENDPNSVMTINDTAVVTTNGVGGNTRLTYALPSSVTDFSYNFTFYNTSRSGNIGSFIMALADRSTQWETSGWKGVGAFFDGLTLNACTSQDGVTGFTCAASSPSIAANTLYYVTVSRTGTTLNVSVFSDSARTTHLANSPSLKTGVLSDALNVMTVQNMLSTHTGSRSNVISQIFDENTISYTDVFAQAEGHSASPTSTGSESLMINVPLTPGTNFQNLFMGGTWSGYVDILINGTINHTFALNSEQVAAGWDNVSFSVYLFESCSGSCYLNFTTSNTSYLNSDYQSVKVFTSSDSNATASLDTNGNISILSSFIPKWSNVSYNISVAYNNLPNPAVLPQTTFVNGTSVVINTTTNDTDGDSTTCLASIGATVLTSCTQNDFGALAVGTYTFNFNVTDNNGTIGSTNASTSINWSNWTAPADVGITRANDGQYFDNGIVIVQGGIGGDNGKAWRSTNYGASWSSIITTGLSSSNVIPYTDNGIYMLGAGSTGVISWSNDTGLTWNAVTADTLGQAGLAYVNNTFIATDGDPYSSRSTDNGTTWSAKIGTGLAYGAMPLAWTNKTGQDIVMVADYDPAGSAGYSTTTYGNLVISYDRGLTWSAPIQTGNGHGEFTLTRALYPNGSDVILYGNYHGEVIMSYDEGLTWSAPVDTGLGNTPIVVQATSINGTIIAGDTGGATLAYSEDYGLTWNTYNTGLTDSSVVIDTPVSIIVMSYTDGEAVYLYKDVTESTAPWVNITQNITVTEVSTYTISGYVNSSTGAALAGANVSYLTESNLTNASGYYILQNFTTGSYNLTVNLSGYNNTYILSTVTSSNLTNQNATMNATPVPATPTGTINFDRTVFCNSDVIGSTITVFALAVMVLAFGMILFQIRAPSPNADIILLSMMTMILCFATLILGNYIIYALISVTCE